MRTRIALTIAAAVVAAPAYGQETDPTNVDAATVNATDPAAAGNAVDPSATVNGMVVAPGTPADANMVLPPATTAPVDTGAAEPVRASRDDDGGIPWGLLGILGLAGLLGRKSRPRES